MAPKVVGLSPVGDPITGLDKLNILEEGTIYKRWENPAYTALDVVLDDGNWQLFWHHELEEVDEGDRGAYPVKMGPLRDHGRKIYTP